MKAYTIHEPPTPPAERMDRADSLVFVKEGISWMALFFAPIWLLLKSLWLVFAGYVIIAALLLGGGSVLGLDNDTISWGFIALHIVIALEADSIERWSLARTGWRELAAVTGRSQDDAERIFFENWLPQQPVLQRRDADGPSLGKTLA